MIIQNIIHDLNAIWLVFGAGYLNHNNAPQDSPDYREKILIDIFCCYLEKELKNFSLTAQNDKSIIIGLKEVLELMRLWSEDLSYIYKVRESLNKYNNSLQLAKRFKERVTQFKNCTIIPNGLISSKRTGNHETTSLGILKKNTKGIDWIQVDPGSAFHQRAADLKGEESSAYLEINEINPENISEDWLLLLIGLKTTHPPGKNGFYKDVSLYECLLAHLNGKTTFKNQRDEDFVHYSHSSPNHVWQVIEKSFCYLLGHFLGDSYQELYQQLVLNFKLFLLEGTFEVYQCSVEDKKEQCHYLLQEMCQQIAQSALENGNETQVKIASNLIKNVKDVINKNLDQEYLQKCKSTNIDIPQVSTLNFDVPNIIHYDDGLVSLPLSHLKVDPLFRKPEMQEDIIDYLKKLNNFFIDKLANTHQLKETSLLSYGIETFFVDFLANTTILEKSALPFSRDDVYLASSLKKLAETYYACQLKIVKNFLDDKAYNPQFYAKNITIQFLAYAAIVALNYRDTNIGPLLAKYNLSTAVSKDISLEKILPFIVISNPKFFKILSTIKTFLDSNSLRETLFSFENFDNGKFLIKIKNDADVGNVEVKFSYELLKKYNTAYSNFQWTHRLLGDEKQNQKWKALAYTETYLPNLYCTLFNMAFLAKASLVGFPSGFYGNELKTSWYHLYDDDKSIYWTSSVSFRNGYSVLDAKPDNDKFLGYTLKRISYFTTDPYKRLISLSNNFPNNNLHFLENEIVATQNEKPTSMDRVRYMHLGFLQSEQLLKYERLYIAIKEQNLDFTSEQDCILIKQTLFEIGIIYKTETGSSTLLEWISKHNPDLIHQLGLLCVQKALAMKLRIVQHQAIGEILEIVIGLIEYFPSHLKESFVKKALEIFSMLKEIVLQKQAHLKDTTLIYINAYLITSFFIDTKLVSTELLTFMTALLEIQKYNIDNITLDNTSTLRMYNVINSLSLLIEYELNQNQSVLNTFMLQIISDWDQKAKWKKIDNNLLYICGEHTIDPLQGKVCFQNRPITGLPYEITTHKIFKEYFDIKNFAVVPSTKELKNTKVPCFLSVSLMPRVRITLVQKELLIEEFINNEYQLYMPSEQLFKNRKYPAWICKDPQLGNGYRYWLANNIIYIKDKGRKVYYEWSLKNNTIFSNQHQNKIVYVNQLKQNSFKDFILRVESSDWIEVIVEQLSSDADIKVLSVNFPRLSLNFYYKDERFYSHQISGYYLSTQQSINTLHGFNHYLVLEKDTENSTYKSIKVIIPHRNFSEQKKFYSKNIIPTVGFVNDPPYFIYDLDLRLGLLKANRVSAHLYLALLYYHTASLDDYDLSHSNAYHLAREYLEKSQKLEPYEKVELEIMQKFLDNQVRVDLHSNHVAIYLKVVSLLSQSLQLSFLYTNPDSVKNTNDTEKTLKKLSSSLPEYYATYLKNSDNILQRIRLTHEEVEELNKYLFVEKHIYAEQFNAYSKIHFEKQSNISLSSGSFKNYKKRYQELFLQTNFNKTSFLESYQNNVKLFNFSLAEGSLDFSNGINGILIARFSLANMILLYKQAYSTVSFSQYRYLLHHMVLRSAISETKFPQPLVMMLARALLLVAENPGRFPKLPSWLIDISPLQFDLSKRSLDSNTMCKTFPEVNWNSLTNYNDDVRIDNYENSRIWDYLKMYDLSGNLMPLSLPYNQDSFSLNYERHINFSKIEKKTEVRRIYLQAARNDALYKFFTTIFQLCDQLKIGSNIGLTIPLVSIPSITVNFNQKVLSTDQNKKRTLTSQKKPSMLQPLVLNFEEFFNETKLLNINKEFPLAHKADEDPNGYEQQFYLDLKNSWQAYNTEVRLHFDWLKDDSIIGLIKCLKNIQSKNYLQINTTWGRIEELLKFEINSTLNQKVFLKKVSGELFQYHKGDLLASILDPNKLTSYNPLLAEKLDLMMENLLAYITYEIVNAKIGQALDLINEYQNSSNKLERSSLLQRLTHHLIEAIDDSSYSFPHWLLFQFENNLIVRSNQRELILAMRTEIKKTMYQLNMGEGKSSVILPLISYELADSEQLLRINILRPLFSTMHNLLHSRFSGLIKRKIYTLPFYRDIDITLSNLNLILKSLKECQRNGGILLVTPEHRMCLQLKIREILLENQQQVAASGVFNWKSYRDRTLYSGEFYRDLNIDETKQLLEKQDLYLKAYLLREKYIDSNNKIIDIPPRGQGVKRFAELRENCIDKSFREWSCLKAAYRELLYNSKVAYSDSTEKLKLLNEINELKTIDLLDESDEILRHGTELNYSIGDKLLFDGGELRWQIAQYFMQTVFCDIDLKKIITNGMLSGHTDYHFSELQCNVPHIEFISKSYYEKNLKPLLAEKFTLNYLTTFRKHQIKIDEPLIKGEKSSLKQYILGELSLNVEKQILNFISSKGQLKDILLIAKGWLSHGILFHVFNAKYRVNYGLHLSGQKQKRIAIPFVGKDSPAERSEFGHPDIMLGFSIISYFYQGLSVSQLKEVLLKLKNKYTLQIADIKLMDWVESARDWFTGKNMDFPHWLTSFEKLDLADELCVSKIHQYLAYNVNVISFYLDQFIFPDEALQYLYKISSNAHFLVGYNPALGFSGTDDRKITMPYDICSLKSPSQQGTNGKLLDILIRTCNSHYYTLDVTDVRGLLTQFCNYVRNNKNCHALIDAGALITGFSNYEVALFLIDNLPENILGIIYFTDIKNSLTVLTRDKRKIALQDCHVNKKNLFAYLDDVHTRGTDLQFPLDCQGLLTVGMDMHKDKLMQAAMRLRGLSHNQSISLWATQKVTLAIVRDNQINAASINSLEVIKWVTRNTINQINVDLFPVLVRVFNFLFLQKAEDLLKVAPTNIVVLEKYCREKEVFALEDFYALSPQVEDLSDSLYLLVAARMKTFWQELHSELVAKELEGTDFYNKVFNLNEKRLFREKLNTICNDMSVYLQKGLIHLSLTNDQEKEVEVEISEEKNVIVNIEKRAPSLEKEWDIKLILKKDFMKVGKEMGILFPLKAISRYVQFPAKSIVWHADIYMTENFINAVRSNVNEMLDNYLRPVDVILFHRMPDKSVCILLSGQEAARIKFAPNLLLGDNFLVHLNDLDGPTRHPLTSKLSKKEEKLLTIVKLFAGECHYPSTKEIQRLAKRIGRMYPNVFVNATLSIDNKRSNEMYSALIEKGYLDFSGTMTEKLFKVLDKVNDNNFSSFEFSLEHKNYNEFILKKLKKIFDKLIFQTPVTLQKEHQLLWQWVGVRGRNKDYSGSVLESALNSEYNLKV